MTNNTHAGPAPAKVFRRVAAVTTVLLTLCLVFMMPVGATGANESAIGSVEYPTLADAIAAANSGDIITLLDDVVVNQEIKITESGINLIGNYHTIRPSPSYVWVNQNENSTNYILEVSGKHFHMDGVIIDDSSRTQTNGFIAAIRLTGEHAILENNTIHAGTSNNHRTAGILIYASANDTVLKNNTIYLGKSGNTDVSGMKQRNESIGIRIFPGDASNKYNDSSIKGPITGLTLLENKIYRNASALATNLPVGILIDGAQPGDQITVAGNTFDLGANGFVLEIMTEEESPSLNLSFADNQYETYTSANLSLLKDSSSSPDFTQTLSITREESIASITKGTGVTLKITSGMFAFDPSSFVVQGFQVLYSSEDRVWIVTDECTVFFETYGGSDVALIILKSGEIVTEPENPTRSGYNFAGWYSDGALTQKYDFNTPVTKDITLYAKWTKKASSTPKKEETPKEEPPVEEPVTPTEPVAGEVTVQTEVTNGGEVSFETPAADGSDPVSDAPVEISAVVLPEGTTGEVAFVPVSEQPAPAGKETQTKKVFEINVPTYEKGKAATVKFTMTVAELEADGKTAADVALWHFDEETGEWTKLVTSYVIVDGVVYFEAITYDFSPFAIIYEDEPSEEPVEEPETSASPAPVIGVLAALGAAAVMRRK